MAFEGKVALITGGGSGMGRLAARNLAAAGKDVAIFDINAEGLAETATGHSGIHHWVVDITDADAVHQAVKDVEAKLGPIDRLYNCAAIMPFGKILEHDANVMKKMMEINYNGLIHITQAVLPGMIARGRGDFISFASMAGLLPTLLTGGYSATKAAVAMFTEILYHENMNSGVRFACVCPPTTNTPLLDQGKATAWPKMLDQGSLLDPQAVLDAIETHIEKGKFWVYPNRDASIGALMRRLAPGLIWKQVHKVEGF